ncbi:MAG: hypothetical protein L0Z50_01885, partial [Verrucomicrobiales bacterium]|nr:hypothetical protein [Verrucomicrobiales bacterium]
QRILTELPEVGSNVFRITFRSRGKAANGSQSLDTSVSQNADEILAVFSEEAVTLWTVRDWSLLLKIKPVGGVEEAELSPSGASCALALKNGSLEFHRVGRAGDPVAVPEAHNRVVRHLSFSPGETMLLSASADHTVKGWDVSSGRARFPVIQHGDAVYWAEFSVDGRLIATASHDKTAVVRDVEKGQTVGAPMEHPGSVTLVRFSPDGRNVLTACDDGMLGLTPRSTRMATRR